MGCGYHDAYAVVAYRGTGVISIEGKFELYSDEMAAWVSAAKLEKNNPGNTYKVKKTRVPLPWVRG